MRAICIDASNQFEDVGFKVTESEVYDVLEVQEIDSETFYLLYRSGFFKYYFNAERFILLSDIDEVDQVEKLLQFLEADYYEQFVKPLK
jgi:hypothetical protein